MPSCMRAPPPEPLMMISGRFVVGGAFDEAGEPFADDRAHAAHDEGRIGDAEGDAAGADHAGAGEGGVAEAGAFLFGDEALGVGLSCRRTRAGRSASARRPILRTCRRRAPASRGRLRRDVQVVPALRADVHQPLRLPGGRWSRRSRRSEPEAAGNASLFAHALAFAGVASDSVVAMAEWT